MSEESDFKRTEARLGAMFRLAVPLWIERVRKYDKDKFRRRQAELASIIASNGDALMFSVAKSKYYSFPVCDDDGNEVGYDCDAFLSSKDAFNAYAESVAMLAFGADGVNVFGCHFDAKQNHLFPDLGGFE